MSNYLNTVTELMQSNLKMVDSWCKTKRLSINGEKSKVVPFTRERKTDGVAELIYQDVKLNLTKEIRYLGIILMIN